MSRQFNFMMNEELAQKLKVHCVLNRISMKDFIENAVKIALDLPVEKVTPKFWGLDEYTKKVAEMFQILSDPKCREIRLEPDYPMYKKDYEELCELASRQKNSVAPPPGFIDDVKATPITYYCKYCDAKVEGPNFCGMCGEKIE